MSALAKIHILKKEAGLDDEAYRDLMERETGVRSAKDLNDKQRGAFITVLNGLCGPVKPVLKTGGKYEKKLQALWIAAYNLGVTDKKSNVAMLKFLKRQTGLDHSRFLHVDADADKAIEGLKEWIRRSTKNDGLFRTSKDQPRLYNNPRFQVCMHIWTELVLLERMPAGQFTDWLKKETGHEWPEDIEDTQWIEVQNKLGQFLRKQRKGDRS